jgi:hypothetical protein
LPKIDKMQTVPLKTGNSTLQGVAWHQGMSMGSQ